MMLLSTTLFVTPAKDTVWWDTPGGKVTGHKDGTDNRCSLMLYDNGGSVSFEWDGQGRIMVIVIDQNWHFPDDWQVPLAIQLGDAWLTDHNGSALIEAVGHGDAVGFALDQAVDDLLRPAGQIRVKTNNTEMSIKLAPAKMDTLLSRTQKCRDTIEK
jgi:hypothetical protein